METAELEREGMMEAEEVNSGRTLTEQSDAASRAASQLTFYFLVFQVLHAAVSQIQV